MDIPQELLSLLRSYGTPAFDMLEEALRTPPTVAVRYNSARGLAPAPGADIVPWCPQGCYLQERPAFTFMPRLHQGAFYVQDASSMFLWHVLTHITRPDTPLRYLDACAAPGGKTTAALDILPQGSLVVANEYVPARASILEENLTKWGRPAVVTRGDTAAFSTRTGAFDIIAADVPCSGEGMMRKDEEAVGQWSASLVDQCVARQRQIVDTLWPALAPGGHFIYSTCTFNRLENEEMIRYITDRYGAQPVDIPCDPAWGIAPGIDTDAPCYRFIPGATRGEGLFMAVLRKPDDADDNEVRHATRPRRDKDNRRPKTSASMPDEVRRWVDARTFDVSPQGVVSGVMPTAFPDFYLQPTLEIGTIKGRDIIPSQALALSTALNKDAFRCVDMPLSQAIAYLRCEAPELPEGTPTGIVLLTYRGLPLGFAKNIGRRANNLYPRRWRILSEPPASISPSDL